MTPRRAAAIAAIGARRIERRRAAIREPEAPQTLAFALLRCDVERLTAENRDLRRLIADQQRLLNNADVCRHAGKCQAIAKGGERIGSPVPVPDRPWSDRGRRGAVLNGMGEASLTDPASPNERIDAPAWSTYVRDEIEIP